MSYNVIPNHVGYPDPAWLEQCLPEIEDFVRDMFIDAAWQEYPEKMTDDDAQLNINEWKNCNVDLPDGLTAPVLADVWNSLIEKGFCK